MKPVLYLIGVSGREPHERGWNTDLAEGLPSAIAPADVAALRRVLADDVVRTTALLPRQSAHVLRGMEFTIPCAAVDACLFPSQPGAIDSDRIRVPSKPRTLQAQAFPVRTTMCTAGILRDEANAQAKNWILVRDMLDSAVKEAGVNGAPVVVLTLGMDLYREALRQVQPIRTQPVADDLAGEEPSPLSSCRIDGLKATRLFSMARRRDEAPPASADAKSSHAEAIRSVRTLLGPVPGTDKPEAAFCRA